MTTEQAKRRPFHETIIDQIRRAECYQDLMKLSEFIKDTKIPKNHESIAAAWNETCRILGAREDMDWVATDVLEQKQETEAEEKEKPLPDALNGDGR